MTIWTSEFPAALSQFCTAEGIPFVDLTEGLQSFAEQGKLPFFAKDEHLNGAGQQAMAEQLAPWVKNMLPR